MCFFDCTVRHVSTPTFASARILRRSYMYQRSPRLSHTLARRRPLPPLGHRSAACPRQCARHRLPSCPSRSMPRTRHRTRNRRPAFFFSTRPAHEQEVSVLRDGSAATGCCVCASNRVVLLHWSRATSSAVCRRTSVQRHWQMEREAWAMRCWSRSQNWS